MQELTSPYIKKRSKKRGGFFRFLLLFLFFVSLAFLSLALLYHVRGESEKLTSLSSLLGIGEKNDESTAVSSGEEAGSKSEISYKEVDLSAGTLGYRYENRTDYTLDNAFFVSREEKADGSILIVATRAYEAYRDYENGISFDGRNMEALGKTLASSLREKGVNALYLPLSEDGVYTYEKAAAALTEYLTLHPNTSYVIDLTRETAEEDGLYLAPLTTANEKKAAQLRLAIGTDAGGGEHPLWRSSLSCADSLFTLLDTAFPSLMMPTLISPSRLNQHLPVTYFTLHVGSFGNSFEEAQESVCLFADVFASRFLQ